METADTPPTDRERLERLKQRVLGAATRPMTTTRAEATPDWRRVGRGIEVRILHRDPARRLQVALWRLAPGAVVPAHAHFIDEECYLIEGDLVHGQQRYAAGDFMVAHAGTRHCQIQSEQGALMLIRGDLLELGASPPA